jgi:toxin CcdB
LRQFDLVANPSIRSRAHAPYFVILQSHHLEALETVIVAPVVRDAQRSDAALDVAIEVDGERLVITMAELFSMERELLARAIGSVAVHEDQIRRALERVFTGF